MVKINNMQQTVKLQTTAIKRQAIEALRLCGLDEAELSISFITHQKMRALNNAYRAVNQSTDVLAFPMHEGISQAELRKMCRKSQGSQSGEFLLGDVVIEPARAKRQAIEHGHSLSQEIKILTVHGLLHLIGYDHEQSASAHKGMMDKQKELLSKIK